MKRKTKEQFVKEAITVHGDKYDYSKTEYIGGKKKAVITCPEHGDFEQTPHNHLFGNGCKKCSFSRMTGNSESFIRKAREIHGKRYGYDNAVYKNSKTKVVINCRVHGDFNVSPDNHINKKSGCPACAGNTTAQEKWIEACSEMHNFKYDYSKAKYTTKDKKVLIICPDHGEFYQEANSHKNGCGCPKCAKYGIGNNEIGFVYLLESECGRYKKIGITKNIKQRISKLKKETPFKMDMIGYAMYDDCRGVEFFLHQKKEPAGFSGFDGATEWFKA